MLPLLRRNANVLIEAGGFYSRKCGIYIRPPIEGSSTTMGVWGHAPEKILKI